MPVNLAPIIPRNDIQGFVIEGDRQIGVIDELMCGENAVIGLDGNIIISGMI